MGVSLILWKDSKWLSLKQEGHAIFPNRFAVDAIFRKIALDNKRKIT